MFERPFETIEQEFDFRELFARILSERDWTDKLEAVYIRIRNRFRLPDTDTKLSKELQGLIPDMKEVAKAYEDMTSGYKEFIRTVLDAKRSSSRAIRNKS
jgi:hypothetical protein